MRRFKCVGLLIGTAMLCAATTASATVWSVRLTPTPEGGEPGASGVATVKHVGYSPGNPTFGSGACYYGILNVTCSGLTAGATYAISPYAYSTYFVAKQNGTGRLSYRATFQPDSLCTIEVYRVWTDSSGGPQWALVLSGVLSIPPAP